MPLFPFELDEFATFVNYFVRNDTYWVYNYAWQRITVANDPGEWQDHGVHIVCNFAARGRHGTHLQTISIRDANK